jgi:cell cycle protein kinase DBF2
MAVSTPLSPKSHQDLNMTMPIPPPLLHTRSGNELYDRPQTPTTPGHAFTSPVQTPQGSPSKKQLPPGANDLPNVFDNAMKLAPMSPTKSQPKSPSKFDHVNKDPFTEHTTQHYGRSESPTRQSNKENAPSSPVRYGGDAHQNHAAISRHEQYHKSESKKTITKGLTTEELQKLQLPKVKRLANVTQLCKYHYDNTNFLH